MKKEKAEEDGLFEINMRIRDEYSYVLGLKTSWIIQLE
jgi:hypothetical protein